MSDIVTEKNTRKKTVRKKHGLSFSNALQELVGKNIQTP